MRYKGVLLDLDNTLYGYGAAHRAGLSSAFALLGAGTGRPADEVGRSYDLARAGVHADLNGTAASHNRLLYFQRTAEILGVNPFRHALRAYEAYWGAFLDAMELYPDAGRFLERAARSGIPVCLVTDLTAHIQHRKVVRLGLDGLVRHIVTSEEAGADKPAPAIFRLALAKLGLGAEDACMAGDDYEKDVRGAASAGIRAFRLARGDEAVEGVESFKSFDGLAEVIF